MTSRLLDPLKLPVAPFAAEGGELAGDWALAELPRLAASECLPEGDEPSGSRAGVDMARRVRWRVVGELRPFGGQHQIWLGLEAGADVVLQCQRCLLPVSESVEVVRRFRFVEDEETAARIDDEIDDEVLVLTPALDLRELVEDEMLLALPLVPRHEECPQPVVRAFGDLEEADAVEAAANPFAVLAALKKSKPAGE